MAFPVIESSSANVQTSNANNWGAGANAYPSGVQSGDLLLFFGASDGSGLLTCSGGTWNSGKRVTDVFSGTAVRLSCSATIADGTESGTFSIANTASEQGGWRCYRISGWAGGTIAAALPSSSGAHDGDAVDSNTSSGSGTSTGDPPSLDPGDWATEDTLWIAAIAIDTSRTISVYPLAGNNTADVSGGSNGATLGLCTTTSAVASLDPGTFTFSASDDWACATVAVRPTAAAATFSPPFSFQGINSNPLR